MRREPPVRVSFVLNGEERSIEAPERLSLLLALRNDFGLNGPKYGCGLGECGSCAVLVGDRAVRACVTPVAAVSGRVVTTLEGLGGPAAPHPVQQAFIEGDAAQCGYCLNGMIIAAEALRRRAKPASEVEIRQALARNLCRCGAHVEILAAVRSALVQAADAGSPA